MGESSIRIEKLVNGYTVEMKDPTIVKKNNARDKNTKPNAPYSPYIDPWRKFVFEKEAQVVSFIKKNLSKALPEDDDSFETSFNTAVASDED